MILTFFLYTRNVSSCAYLSISNLLAPVIPDKPEIQLNKLSANDYITFCTFILSGKIPAVDSRPNAKSLFTNFYRAARFCSLPMGLICPYPCRLQMV